MGTQTEKQRIGQIGEDIACTFLVKKGFTIIDRNYRKKWGEIDIIAEKGRELHFIEVKTVTHENNKRVTRGTDDQYRAEDNVHPWKLQRLSRAIQSYLAEKGREEGEWVFSVIVIRLDEKQKTAKVRHIRDIVLEERSERTTAFNAGVS